MTEPEDSWAGNYFNYFTEVEEHFQRVRGTSLFLLSPLDWALIESWKSGGVPLTAVLRGIDAAFEKWRGRKSRTQMVNSLAFCAQAVLTEAQVMAGCAGQTEPRQPGRPALSRRRPAELSPDQCASSARPVIRRSPRHSKIWPRETELHYRDLEQLEQRLTALEEKLIGTLKSVQSDEELFLARRELDAQLRPYRGKMTADQLTMLERQYFERRLLEEIGCAEAEPVLHAMIVCCE